MTACAQSTYLYTNKDAMNPIIKLVIQPTVLHCPSVVDMSVQPKDTKPLSADTRVFVEINLSRCTCTTCKKTAIGTGRSPPFHAFRPLANTHVAEEELISL